MQITRQSSIYPPHILDSSIGGDEPQTRHWNLRLPQICWPRAILI